MYFDDLLTNHVGEWGKSQIIILLVTSMTNFPLVFNNLGIVFLAASPDHWCAVPELDNLNISVDYIKNVTIPVEEMDGVLRYRSCQQYNVNFTGWSHDDVEEAVRGDHQEMWETTTCQNGWNYDLSIYRSTIVTQWNLVCDKSWLRATSSAVYMAGLMVGVFGLGTLSDMIGRLPILWISLILVIISSIATAFSPNILIFTILRFFVGAFSVSVTTTAHVLLAEVVGPSYRVFAFITSGYFWITGYALVSGLAYGLRDWVYLQLAFTLIPVLLIFMFLFLHESPRWLFVQKKTEKANKIVRRMSYQNKTNFPENLQIHSENKKKINVCQLLTTKHLRGITLILFFQWFMTGLVYYGLSLNTSNLGGNDFINFFIAAAVEVPANFLAHRALVKLGRRIPLSFVQITGGVAMLCTMAVPKDLNWVKIVLAMYGKFCLTVCFAVLIIYTVELFPTVIRNTAFGSCSLFARIGATISPYTMQLAIINRYIPFTVYGALCVTAGSLVVFLPETKGKPVPETLEDGRKSDKSAKPWRCLQCVLKKPKQRHIVEELQKAALV